MTGLDLENEAAEGPIASMISDGESFVKSAKGAKGSGKSRAQFVLTDQKLIRYKKGLLSESTDTYRLTNISAVDFSSTPFKRILSISGSGVDEDFGLHPDSDPEEFANMLREQVAEA